MGRGGKGAWEAALRRSQMDLNDGSVAGGELTDLSFGLNWYMTANSRIMFNYVMADLDGVGEADMIVIRFQADF